MEIILNEKIRNLGGLGERVNVKSGFARNYLIPQGKAMQATKKNLEVFEANRAALEKALAEKLKSAEAVATKLRGMEVVIKGHAGEGGRLFGSIGPRDLAIQIAKLSGVEVAKHQIHFADGVIRMLGEYDVVVQLHADVDVPVKVKVVTDQVMNHDDAEAGGDVDA